MGRSGNRMLSIHDYEQVDKTTMGKPNYNHPDIASNQTPRIVLTIVLLVASLSNTVLHRFEKLFFNTYPAAVIAKAVFLMASRD